MSIFKPAAVLLAICVIVSALLGYVNNVTTAPIAEADKKATQESMSAVLPETENWGETVEVSEDGNIIKTYTPGLNADGSVKGYAVSVETKGFSSGLKLMFGIDANSSDENGTEEGAITGLSIVDNSNETPGLGANSSKPEFCEQYKGKKGQLSVKKGGGAGESEIDSITGATITTKAITDAANQVQDYYNNTLAKEGK